MKQLISLKYLAQFIILGCLIMFSTACGPTPPAQPAEITVDPLRFAEAVNDYKSADSMGMPRPNSILFVGSSSIHGWKTLAKDFPEVRVINRGLGGSHMSDLIYYMDDIVFPYNPNAIVVYEGDNDIASGKSPEKVYADYLSFVSKVRERWPKKPIFFIAIKPSLARVEVMDRMAQANMLIKAHIESQPAQYYVDVFTPMLGSDGLPRPELFKEDGLHMNEAGYALWIHAIKTELGLE